MTAFVADDQGTEEQSRATRSWRSWPSTAGRVLGDVVLVALPPLTGLLAGVLLGASDVLLFLTLATWTLGVRAARSSSLAARLGVGGSLEAAVLTVAVVAMAVAVTSWDEAALADAVLVVLASTLVLVAVQLWGLRSTRPVRVALLGDVVAVQAASSQWAGRRDIDVVGALTFAVNPDGNGLCWADDDADDLRRQVEGLRAEAVVVLPDAGLRPGVVERLCWALESTSTTVAVWTGYQSVARHRVDHADLGGASLSVIRRSRPGRAAALSKQLGDRALALVALVAIAPALLVIAVAIRLDSPGPAFFRQVRVGRGGRTFAMWKFRTMVHGAEHLQPDLLDLDEGNGVLFKIKADPRITRLGRTLRASSLDELPQLVNVLRGEMSLVGPRPALPHEVESYDVRARRRLQATPGLTGLWQVSGRSTLDWDESIALDLRYVDNITLRGDLAICLRTVRAVATRRGAY